MKSWHKGWSPMERGALVFASLCLLALVAETLWDGRFVVPKAPAHTTVASGKDAPASPPIPALSMNVLAERPLFIDTRRPYVPLTEPAMAATPTDPPEPLTLLATVLAEGRQRWTIMIRRARKHLTAEGWLEMGGGKKWRITPEGRKAAAVAPLREQAN